VPVMQPPRDVPDELAVAGALIDAGLEAHGHSIVAAGEVTR
jgi:hypothetical protein